jgi:hypothetical protein
MPGGRTLFEFGDKNGVGSDARFQHPLGIALQGETLFVADSYNHQVKTVSLAKRSLGTVAAFAGSSEAGGSLEPIAFSEPAGLAVSASGLFVADTNNHRVVTIDLKSKKATQLKIKGLQPPKPDNVREAATGVPEMAAVAVEEKQVGVGDAAGVVVELSLPERFKLNPLYPSAVVATSAGAQSIIAEDALGRRLKATVENSTAKFSLPLTGKTGTADVSLAFSYGYCRDGAGGVCKVGRARWELPLSVVENGPGEFRLKAAPAEVGRGG